MEQKVHALINQLELLATLADEQNETISKGNVGWHLGHSLMTIRGILRLVETSDPGTFSPKFSLAKLYVMTLGKMPRGRKAPAKSTPQEAMSAEAIKEMAAVVRQKVGKISHFSKNSYFSHPVFGHLPTKDAIKFIGIHTRHHLAIIGDILAANGKKP